MKAQFISLFVLCLLLAASPCQAISMKDIEGYWAEEENVAHVVPTLIREPFMWLGDDFSTEFYRFKVFYTDKKYIYALVQHISTETDEYITYFLKSDGYTGAEKVYSLVRWSLLPGPRLVQRTSFIWHQWGIMEKSPQELNELFPQSSMAGRKWWHDLRENGKPRPKTPSKFPRTMQVIAPDLLPWYPDRAEIVDVRPVNKKPPGFLYIEDDTTDK